MHQIPDAYNLIKQKFEENVKFQPKNVLLDDQSLENILYENPVFDESDPCNEKVNQIKLSEKVFTEKSELTVFE